MGMLTFHTAARRKFTAFVRAWGSGARASISFWERDYNSRDMSLKREEKERRKKVYLSRLKSALM